MQILAETTIGDGVWMFAFAFMVVGVVWCVGKNKEK